MHDICLQSHYHPKQLFMNNANIMSAEGDGDGSMEVALGIGVGVTGYTSIRNVPSLIVLVVHVIPSYQGPPSMLPWLTA